MIKNYTAVRSREIKKSLSRKKESFSREKGELFPGEEGICYRSRENEIPLEKNKEAVICVQK